MAELDFPGYAVGGLSVGEAREDTMEMAEKAVRMLPGNKPRYMMGMGTPSDLVEQLVLAEVANVIARAQIGGRAF